MLGESARLPPTTQAPQFLANLRQSSISRQLAQSACIHCRSDRSVRDWW